MATAQQQAELDALNAEILRRCSGNAQVEGQDAGDRWRLESLESLVRLRNTLQSQINRANRGGIFKTYDAARSR